MTVMISASTSPGSAMNRSMSRGDRDIEPRRAAYPATSPTGTPMTIATQRGAETDRQRRPRAIDDPA